MRPESSDYRLDELGWLQFERLCSLVLEHEGSLAEVEWRGHADQGRVALVDADVVINSRSARLRGPVAIAVVWARAEPSLADRLSHLFTGVSAIESELGFWFDRVLVLTNLDAGGAQRRLEQRFGQVKRFVVLGARELGERLDRDPRLRAAMPSVLGLRDLEPLIDSDVRERSSLDIGSAQRLARVFWPTRAYERARAVLWRHRFVVLTGPSALVSHCPPRFRHWSNSPVAAPLT